MVSVLHGQRIFASLERLSFQECYSRNASDAQYVEPPIAIRQFSSGLSHILALSDSGKVWS
jgi:SCF-associated factor 1